MLSDVLQRCCERALGEVLPLVEIIPRREAARQGERQADADDLDGFDFRLDPEEIERGKPFATSARIDSVSPLLADRREEIVGQKGAFGVGGRRPGGVCGA
jgi:hypothetical protein